MMGVATTQSIKHQEKHAYIPPVAADRPHHMCHKCKLSMNTSGLFIRTSSSVPQYHPTHLPPIAKEKLEVV